MSTIKITEEMCAEVRDQTGADLGDARNALERAIAIIERDYTIVGGPVPDGVNMIKDKDGDAWHRMADGRWFLEGDGMIRSGEDMQQAYGPVTW